MTPCSPDRLAAGQTLCCAFSAGDELFCAAGTLQLQTSAVAGIEALPGLQLQLCAGQGWRAPAALRLQVTAVGAPARMRYSPATVPLQTPPAMHWPARVGALFRSWRTLVGT